MKGRIVRFISILVLFFTGTACWAAPRVVTDIAPVHGLVSVVMEGVGEPELILPQGADPHHYALRPSQGRNLSRADIVFWVGPAMTPWLEKAIESLANDAIAVALSLSTEIERLPVREDHHDQDSHDHEGDVDPHIWLDPSNAQKMVQAISRVLSEVDPENSETYSENSAKFASQSWEALASVGLSTFSGHDAYQYFERAFGLNFLGAVTQTEDAPPSAGHIRDLRGMISAVDCLMIEPNAPVQDLRTLLGAADLPVVVIDPIGVDIPLGPAFYTTLMQRNIKALEECKP